MSPLDLLGAWHLERRIDDRRAGAVLHVVGTTRLDAVGEDRVDWREDGVLHRPGHRPAEVHRDLRVERRPGATASGWWVVFDHGGDFHPWSPGAWVTHPCAADTYRGLVETTGPTAWRVTWEVTGPAKDHTITSHLIRPA